MAKENLYASVSMVLSLSTKNGHKMVNSLPSELS